MDEIMAFLAEHNGEIFIGGPGLILGFTLLLKIARWWILRSKAKAAAPINAPASAAASAPLALSALPYQDRLQNRQTLPPEVSKALESLEYEIVKALADS